MEAISLVILSGGKSSRMGSPKANLEINGHTFVEKICQSMGNADEILFSVRKKEDFPEVNLPHIADDYPGCGPMAGIQSALKNARNDWVFVVACDSPFVSWEVVETMYRHVADDIDAVIPVEEDGRLHPVCGLYHKKLEPFLRNQLQEGNYRLGKLLNQCQSVFLPVGMFSDHDKVFRNVNTMEEYKDVIIIQKEDER